MGRLSNKLINKYVKAQAEKSEPLYFLVHYDTYELDSNARITAKDVIINADYSGVDRNPLHAMKFVWENIANIKDLNNVNFNNPDSSGYLDSFFVTSKFETHVSTYNTPEPANRNGVNILDHVDNDRVLLFDNISKPQDNSNRKDQILEQLYDLERSDDPGKKVKIIDLKNELKQLDPNADFFSYYAKRKAQELKNINKDRPDENYNSEQLQRGIGIEMEHTNDLASAKDIAKDHLDELSDYYTKLDKYIESELILSTRIAQTPTIDINQMITWLSNTHTFNNWIVTNINDASQINDFIDQHHNDSTLVGLYNEYLASVRNDLEDKDVQFQFNTFTDAAKNAANILFQNDEKRFSCLINKISNKLEEINGLDDIKSTAHKLLKVSQEGGVPSPVGAGSALGEDGAVDTADLAGPSGGSKSKKKKDKKGQITKEPEFIQIKAEVDEKGFKPFYYLIKDDNYRVPLTEAVLHNLYGPGYNFDPKPSPIGNLFDFDVSKVGSNIKKKVIITLLSSPVPISQVPQFIRDKATYLNGDASPITNFDFLKQYPSKDNHLSIYELYNELTESNPNRSNEILEQVYDLQHQKAPISEINKLKEEWKTLNPNKDLPLIFSKKHQRKAQTTEDTLRKDLLPDDMNRNRQENFNLMPELFTNIKENIGAAQDLLQGITEQGNPQMYQTWVKLFGDIKGIEQTRNTLHQIMQWLNKLSEIPQFKNDKNYINPNMSDLTQLQGKKRSILDRFTIAQVNIDSAILESITKLNEIKQLLQFVEMNTTDNVSRSVALNLNDKIVSLISNVQYLGQLHGGDQGVGSSRPSLYP